LAYVEVLPDEKQATTVGFLLRAVALTDRHNCETPCNRTGLSSMGGQVAMGTWGCETKPSPRGIPCPAAC
jgi:hypothetical protein